MKAKENFHKLYTSWVISEAKFDSYEKQQTLDERYTAYFKILPFYQCTCYVGMRECFFKISMFPSQTHPLHCLHILSAQNLACLLLFCCQFFIEPVKQV